jgi:uncharacterized protein (TIGR03437 family)
MLKTTALCVAFAAVAAGAGFPLGLDYSVGLPGSNSMLIAAVDGAGSMYLLNTAGTNTLVPTTVLGGPVPLSSYVTKLTPDGGRIAYITMLGFVATAMAVDSKGSVYVAGPNLVAKLDTGGASFVYQISIAPGCFLAGLAVDNAGHAFVAGTTNTTPLATTPNAFQPTAAAGFSHAFVVKLNAGGTGFDYATYLAGSSVDSARAIAVNGSGEAFVTGQSYSAGFPTTPGAYNRTPAATKGGAAPFLARLSADGSSLVYSTFTGGSADQPFAVAVSPQGSAVVYQQGSRAAILLRFNPQGTALEFSRTLPAFLSAGGNLAVDAAGNTYATGSTTDANFTVKNSLSACGASSVFLTVADPSGNLLQSTYVAGASPTAEANALALGLNGAVYMAGLADSSFVPTQQVSGVSGGSLFLVRLSASSVPPTVHLACLGNAGSFQSGTVAAGEIISLFGEGLGPVQGVTPTVSAQDSFPVELAGVAVTFDGTPAPLLYVQDGQINTVVPWHLTTGATTKVCVSYGGATTNCVTRTVSAAAPGVFTFDGVYAAAINQDGTVNSAANPAPIGSAVAIFGTGLGQVTPMPRDGAITALPLGTDMLPTKIGVLMGGIIFSIVPMDVEYAGPAPLEVAGVSQINVAASPNQMSLVTGSDFYNPVGRSQAFLIHVAGH